MGTREIVKSGIATAVAILAAVTLLIEVGAAGDIGEGEQDLEQQSCINHMNKAGEAVSKATSKALIKCESDASSCDKAEANLAKALARTERTEKKKCDPKNLPDFAFTGAEQVNESAVGATGLLFEGLFANGLLTEDENVCQVHVAKTTARGLDMLYRVGNRSKRASLAKGADSALELQREIVAGIDEGGKLRSGAEHALGRTIGKCNKADLGDVVPGCSILKPTARNSGGDSKPDDCKPGDSKRNSKPGDCKPPAGGGAVASCIVDASRCSWCLAFNGMDDLTIDCDDFDDGKENGSCGEVDPDPDPDPELCERELCAADEELSGQCSVFLAGCLAEELGEEECVGGALLICEGGPPEDVDESNVCSRELCELDADLAEHCEEFLGLCLAVDDFNSEECVGAALFICGGEAI